MIFRTCLDAVPSETKIDYRSKILMLGSCFTNNIGQKLESACFDVCINPFGTLYNPYSIFNSLDILMNCQLLEDKALFASHGLFHSFHFHSQFSGRDKLQTLAGMNESIAHGHQFLQKSDFLFITLGSSYVYEHKAEGYVVNNCHKLPASTFSRYCANLDDMVDAWQKMLARLFQYHPHLRVIFTVSPIRHIADGLHENQISKAKLLILTDTLCSQYNNCMYFPAYEVVMDDLRDYRFYTEDMVHPNNVAIEYIWELFRKSYMDASIGSTFDKIIKLQRAATHKAFDDKSEAYQLFLKQALAELNALHQKNPYLSIKKLQTALENKLN